MKRIGIYPGTFDPVHKGHVAFALEALRCCQLERVIFLPERTPRAKTDVTPLAQRILWLERTIAHQVGLQVTQLASTRFTVAETLPEIQSLLPGTELTLLLGSDVAQNLGQWENLNKLLDTVSLAIGIRAGQTRQALQTSFEELRDTLRRPIEYVLVASPHPAVSSSQLRRQV